MSSAAAEQDGSPALAVEGLVAGYGGVIALDGVSISAGTAAITAVLGANGAGKTTLLRAVSGMIRPRRGRVLLGGTDLAGRSPEQMVRAGIAHVPEGQGVIGELTVEENLRVGMMSWPGALSRAAAGSLVPELAGRTGGRARRGLRALPAAGRPPAQAGRHAVRRRAADAGHSARAAVAAARAAARRAVARPRAQDHGPGHGPGGPAEPGARAHHRLGRAERARARSPSPITAWCSTSAGSSLPRMPQTLAADVALRHHYLGFYSHS